MRIIFFVITLMALLGCASRPKPLTEEAFSRIYLDSLSKRFTHVSFLLDSNLTIRGSNADLSIKIYAANAYKDYLQEPDSIGTIISHYMASVNENFFEEKVIDQKNIMPVIRHASYVNYVDSVNGNDESGHLFREKYNADLFLVYAQDLEKGISLLTQAAVTALPVVGDSLKRIAFRNMERLIPEVKSFNDNGIYMITADGSYEASLILLPEIWTKANFPVKGNIVIAIPNRDVLLVTGSDDPEALKRLKEKVAASFQNGTYALSENLYILKGDKFELWR